jgi:hypothetical protein
VRPLQDGHAQPQAPGRLDHEDVRKVCAVLRVFFAVREPFSSVEAFFFKFAIHLMAYRIAPQLQE